MRIGIIVDGSAEAIALRGLFAKIRYGNIEILPPVYADLQPKADPKIIALKTKSAVKALKSKRVEKIILLIDREDNKICPHGMAENIERTLFLLHNESIQVVVKNRQFENWIIADPQSLQRFRGRLTLPSGFVRKVSPNKADHIVDPIALLNSATNGKRRYHKRVDATSFCNALNPITIALNSRSFRRLLRVIGHPRYENQSILPE